VGVIAPLLSRFDRWLERHFGGYVTVGRLTVYGWNAMYVAFDYRTRCWGYVCFHPPLYWCGQWWPWYFYLSPNATPWASTFALGPTFSVEDRRRAAMRRRKFGHGFDTEKHREELYALNAEVLR
jgi:hypothetical protein